jgi:hypothetical protein
VELEVIILKILGLLKNNDLALMLHRVLATHSRAVRLEDTHPMGMALS